MNALREMAGRPTCRLKRRLPACPSQEIASSVDQLCAGPELRGKAKAAEKRHLEDAWHSFGFDSFFFWPLGPKSRLPNSRGGLQGLFFFWFPGPENRWPKSRKRFRVKRRPPACPSKEIASSVDQLCAGPELRGKAKTAEKPDPKVDCQIRGEASKALFFLALQAQK